MKWLADSFQGIWDAVPTPARTMLLWFWYAVVMDRIGRFIRRAWSCRSETGELLMYTLLLTMGVWLQFNPTLIGRPAFDAMRMAHPHHPEYWTWKYEGIGAFGLISAAASCNYLLRCVMVIFQWLLVFFTCELVFQSRSDAWLIPILGLVLIGSALLMLKLFLDKPGCPKDERTKGRLLRFQERRAMRWAFPIRDVR